VMISLNALQDQITMIIAEHKTCGGHCHPWGEINDQHDYEKENAHLATIITYYAWGVINNGICRDH